MILDGLVPLCGYSEQSSAMPRTTRLQRKGGNLAFMYRWHVLDKNTQINISVTPGWPGR